MNQAIHDYDTLGRNPSVWIRAVDCHMAEYGILFGRLQDDELTGYGLVGRQEIERRRNLE